MNRPEHARPPNLTAKYPPGTCLNARNPLQGPDVLVLEEGLESLQGIGSCCADLWVVVAKALGEAVCRDARKGFKSMVSPGHPWGLQCKASGRSFGGFVGI